MNQSEAVTKILEIKVRYDDALQKIAEYNKKIDEAKVRQLTLNAQFKAGGMSSEEFSKQMEAMKIDENLEKINAEQIMEDVRTGVIPDDLEGKEYLSRD